MGGESSSPGVLNHPGEYRGIPAEPHLTRWSTPRDVAAAARVPIADHQVHSASFLAGHRGACRTVGVAASPQRRQSGDGRIEVGRVLELGTKWSTMVIDLVPNEGQLKVVTAGRRPPARALIPTTCHRRSCQSCNHWTATSSTSEKTNASNLHRRCSGVFLIPLFRGDDAMDGIADAGSVMGRMAPCDCGCHHW
jgi:hypothetical protein